MFCLTNRTPKAPLAKAPIRDLLVVAKFMVDTQVFLEEKNEVLKAGPSPSEKSPTITQA